MLLTPAFTIRMGSACVAEQTDKSVSIERIDDLSIVSLKVSRKSLESACNRLQLASPTRASSGDPRSLWLGPDRWLLVSTSTTPDVIVRNCQETLTGIVHNAVDYSAGLTVFRLGGPNASQTLASGSGLDFRPEKYPLHTCCRTRLAQVAAVIVAAAAGRFDVYVDRSYGTYLTNWLADVSRIGFSSTSNR